MSDDGDPNDEFQDYIEHVSQVPRDVRKSVPRFPDSRKGTKVDNHVLLADMISLSKDLGHPPDSREMDKYGPRKTQTYQERFGSYPAAMELLGFEPKFVSSRQKARYIAEIDNLDEYLDEPSKPWESSE